MKGLVIPHTPRSARRRLLAAVGVAVAAVLVGAPAALAAPANDDFAAATQIAALPFSATDTTVGATIEPSEPQFCSPADNSVWYAITPSADGTLSTDTSGTSLPAQVTVYRQDGTGLGGLSFVGCENFASGPVVFPVAAGQTYYIQGSTPFFSGGGQLQVNVKAVVPPTNDDFAAATPITGVPFAADPDVSAASVEAGEPLGCAGNGQRTVWYAFRPPATGSYQASTFISPLAVYTGSSLSTLTQVGCGGPSPVIFHADAGTTYYLQVSPGFGPGGSVHLSVDVAPPAMADFASTPSDPSMFDTVQFYDLSSTGGGIASESWTFGDGQTAGGCCPAHRYAADGDYAATLSITTTDGRSASSTQTIHVMTHDVAIGSFSVPATARVGKSVSLTVGVSNTRYPETVDVALLRSVPGGGFEQVGQVTQTIPVGRARKTTPSTISYTFTPADATVGKVTFEATATIIGARDANPADNTVIAVATKVRK